MTLSLARHRPYDLPGRSFYKSIGTEYKRNEKISEFLVGQGSMSPLPARSCQEGNSGRDQAHITE